MTVLLVALGAAVGAPLRYLVDRAVQARHDSVFPWGTFAVNVAGSLVLGLLVGLAANEATIALLGTGFCGALTTYSTFGYETLRLLESRARRYAVLNAAATVLVGLAAAYAGVAAGHAARPAPSARTTPGAGPVVLVGLPGLRAQDISPSRTPTLRQLLTDGASASLSTRAVRRETCPADGWLTVNAGAAATLPDPAGCPFPAVVPTGDGGARVDGFGAIAAGNEQFRLGARFGGFAASAARAGCATAIGPGAALALADPAGLAARYLPDPATADPRELSRCPLTVVDLGALPAGAGRDEALRRADAELARLGAALPAGATTIVAGLADSGAPARLHVLLAAGPRFGAGRLDSTATRQPGLVPLTDLAPTVLDALGAANRPAVTVTRSEPPDLRGQAVAADVQRDALVPFFTAFAIVLIGLAALVPWAWSRPRPARAVGWLAIGLASLPAATFLANLAPWWTVSHPAVALAALVLTAAVAIGALAALGPWRRQPWGPAAAVALVTVATLAGDAVTGSRLHIDALYGHSSLVAGRFYGFGNSTYAVFAVATLLLAAALAHAAVRRGAPGRAVLAVGAVGLGAVAVDGWPAWGADFGGVLALVPAFALLALWVAGVCVTARRLLLTLAGAVAAVALIATLDWLRPAGSRSHLGAFVQEILDGRAGDVLHRKAVANLHSFTDNYLSLLVPVAIGLVALLVLRPATLRAQRLETAYRNLPTLRPGLAAVTVAAVLGFAVNDSGATVPAMALTLAVPLAAAIVLRVAPAAAG